jgi:hypothetical protein
MILGPSAPRRLFFPRSSVVFSYVPNLPADC